jgi:small subunit ribosomal protein S16
MSAIGRMVAEDVFIAILTRLALWRETGSLGARAAFLELRTEVSVAVRIRLKRFGRRHQPSYRLAAMDSRQPRNGEVIEELGSYHPDFPQETQQVVLKKDRIEYWLSVGAQPSDTVRRLLKKHGLAVKE